MAQKSKLSLLEYLSLGGAVLKALIAVVVATLTGFFRGSFGAPTYRQHIKCTGLRTLTHHSTIRQLQAFAPSTRSSYTEFAAQKGLPLVESDLGDGMAGFWLGDKSAKSVLLWLHGGGYVMTATPAHLHLLYNLITAATDRGIELAVFFLEYAMAPEAQYPQQLKQVTSALRHLLVSEGRKPESVLLGGDSAGGNLALALLSHLSHPHVGVPPVKLSQNLRGAVLLSPWVTFQQDSVSMRTNGLKDSLDLVALRSWSDAFMGSAKSDYSTDPITALVEWWQYLKADEVCITAGRDEVFRDDIVEMAMRIKVHKEELELFVAQGEAHDVSLMNYVLGGTSDLSEQFFLEWVLKRLD